MPPSDTTDQNDKIQAAYGAADAVGLMRAYAEEAERLEGQGEMDAALFFLTHAYIWALDVGSPEAHALHGRLKAAGRET